MVSCFLSVINQMVGKLLSGMDKFLSIFVNMGLIFWLFLRNIMPIFANYFPTKIVRLAWDRLASLHSFEIYSLSQTSFQFKAWGMGNFWSQSQASWLDSINNLDKIYLGIFQESLLFLMLTSYSRGNWFLKLYWVLSETF